MELAVVNNRPMGEDAVRPLRALHGGVLPYPEFHTGGDGKAMLWTYSGEYYFDEC